MKSIFNLCLFSATLLLLTKCTPPAPVEVPIFQHEVTDESTPWSHTEFDTSSNKFTFAIFTDLNGGEREGVFSTAVEQINLFRPEFVMSVGDLIDGGTEDRAQLTKEWDSFDDRAAKLTAPLFYVGGNHDLTNVEMRKFWEDRFGPRYYHFLYKNVLFLVLDSEDYQEERMQEIYVARAEAIEILDGLKEGEFEDTDYYGMPERGTGEIGSEQSAYFKKVLGKYPEVRWTLVFMHKPVWMREDDGGLSVIEAALGERPYSVFNGHFHSFSYTEKNGRDYTILGTTGGSQNSTDENSFDHISLVTMTNEGPNVAHIKMEGILDKTGTIPSSE